MADIPSLHSGSWSITIAPQASDAEKAAIDTYFSRLGRAPSSPTGLKDSAFSVRLIKKGVHREVAQLQGQGADLFVKSNRLHNLRARARRWFRPAKSQLEFDTLRELAQLGIGTIEPVAWAEQQGGLNLLFTRTIAHSQTLEEVHAQGQTKRAGKENGSLPIPSKAAIAQACGALLAAMHRAGFIHPDPHPGNLLWSSENQTLRIIDLHQVKRVPRITLNDRCRDLAAWAAWTDLRLTVIDNLRLLKRYAVHFEGGKLKRAAWRQLVATIRSHLQERQEAFWRKQGALCLRGGHRRFARFRQASAQGMALGDQRDLMQKIAQLPAPGEPVPKDARILKESASSRVFRIALDGQNLIVKQVPWKKKWTSRLVRWFGFDPVRRAWYWTNALRLRLLPTPVSQGYFLDRRKQCSVLVTSEIAGARQLDDWVNAQGAGNRSLRAMARQLACTLRRMHERGVQHRDLKAANILVDGENKAWLVDLAGAGAAPKRTQERESRCKKDLARLAVSFWAHTVIRSPLKLRFLKTYLWGRSLPRDAWKTWWRELAATAEQRIRRNEGKGRPVG